MNMNVNISFAFGGVFWNFDSVGHIGAEITALPPPIDL